MGRLRALLRSLDIQTKIILVLVAVIVPTFLIVTVIENKLTQPILEGEMLHLGTTTAESLATKIVSNRWLPRSRPAPRPGVTMPANIPPIEDEIMESLYRQPNIQRMDVYEKDDWGALRLVASNMEEEVGTVSTTVPLVEEVASEFHRDEDGMPYWEITVPIVKKGSKGRHAQHVLGVVHLIISTKTISRLTDAFWKITGAAAVVSVVILILVLTFFLRKAVANERLLRAAEHQNLQLSEQLHETQRELMNVEKLAVMGQLTANFAHEIGTPLNAIGGHLQLLREDEKDRSGKIPAGRAEERLEIIQGELLRIEKIVKGFLQTTAKPVSQHQLVDLNQLVNRALSIMRPRLERLGVEVTQQLDRAMGPLRVVPLDIEQILLNLMNNALDSIQSKRLKNDRARLELRVKSGVSRIAGEEWAEVALWDSGLGISKQDLKNVIKPFFTTKRPGEGTGLGLTICSQLAGKYGGVLDIDSKEGAWAEVKLRIPYRK